MSVYNKFAGVYDKMGSDEFSVKMFDYTQRILTRLRYRPRSVLDLACGTGTVAARWAHKNIVTYGVDGSADMLAVAREKARSERVKIHFSQQPMASFTIDHPVDLVTCYFDSLNYLLSLPELHRCFTCVRDALNPNGYFVFDVNTPEAMKVIWGAEVYADASDDLAWVWKNCYFPKAKRAEVHATFFVKENGGWDRFDEIHAERGYTATEIRTGLRDSGFKLVGLYDCLRFVKPDRTALRIAAVAQKVG